MNDFAAMLLILSNNFIKIDGPKCKPKPHEFWIDYETNMLWTCYVIFTFYNGNLTGIIKNDNLD